MLLLLLLACSFPVVATEAPLVPEERARVVDELIGVWALDSRDSLGQLLTGDVFAIDAQGGGMRMRAQENGGWGEAQPMRVRQIRGDYYTQLRLEKLDMAGDYRSPTGQIWCPVRLSLNVDRMMVSLMDPQWFYARKDQDLGLDLLLPGTLVTVVEDGQTISKGSDVILRGSSRELARWVRRHRDEEGLYMPALDLIRQSPTPPP